MDKTNIFSVCVVIRNNEGKVLAVTRKDDHNDWGFPGGKIDPEDATPEDAIRREVKEETGLELANLTFKFIRDCIHKGTNKPAAVFTADAVGEINFDEPHLVDWVDPRVVTEGTFGTFNISTFGKLNIAY